MLAAAVQEMLLANSGPRSPMADYQLIVFGGPIERPQTAGENESVIAVPLARRVVEHPPHAHDPPLLLLRVEDGGERSARIVKGHLRLVGGADGASLSASDTAGHWSTITLGSTPLAGTRYPSLMRNEVAGRSR